jgi:hypothetical protein
MSVVLLLIAPACAAVLLPYDEGIFVVPAAAAARVQEELQMGRLSGLLLLSHLSHT